MRRGAGVAEPEVLRSARAVVFTAVCVLLAALGHGLAHGTAPDAAAVLAGAGAVGLVAARFTDRERSLPQITIGLAAAQLGLHALFNAIQAPVHHHSPGMVMADADPLLGASVPMWLAHAAAGLLAAWWLRGGERLLWAASRRVIAALASPFRAVTMVRPVAVHTVPLGWSAWAPSSPGAVVLRHSVVRRGPPAAASPN